MVAHGREAALRALDAGYDIREVHAAHGYLIHQFLSPLTNLRDDEYGGDLQGRMRLCLDILEAVRTVWPAHLPVFMRVSAVDGLNSRWSVDDTVALVREARARGLRCRHYVIGRHTRAGHATLVPRLPAITFRTRSACAEKPE